MARKLSKVSASEMQQLEHDLKELFGRYNDPTGINEAAFAKLCSECGVTDAKFSSNDVALVFTAVKVGKKKSLNFGRFQEAIRKVAIQKEVTYQELIQVMKEHAPAATDDTGEELTDEKLGTFFNAFKSIDVDHSGEIDANELSKLLKLLGEDGDDAACLELMKEVDLDGSGQISFDEFVAMMCHKQGLTFSGTGATAEERAQNLRRRASNLMMMTSQGGVLKSGKMLKQATKGVVRNWKLRFFELKEDRIVYYKAEGDEKIQGQMEFIHGCSAEFLPDHAKAGCFVLHGERDLHMICEDDTERNQWIDMINSAVEKWEIQITKTLALLLGDDPAAATERIMQSGENYACYMQNRNGISLSPIYIRTGSPVPVKFEWFWPNLDGVTAVEYRKRGLGGGGKWNQEKVGQDQTVTVTLRPGNGYSFKWKKGEDDWLSPLGAMPSLLFKLRKVPLLGTLISTLPEKMQRKVNELPDGKVKDMLMGLADMMPTNPFDVSATVRVEYGYYHEEEQILTRGQKLLKLKDEKLSDPNTRFALRVTLLSGAVIALAKGFELAGIGFLGVFLKESIDTLFIPNKDGTYDGLLKLENAKDADGAKKYAEIEECWEVEREHLEEECNYNNKEFQGGLRVHMPDFNQVKQAARSRQPVVQQGATIPVLFQWPNDASEVNLMLCELGEYFAKLEAEEHEVKMQAKNKWQAEQVTILKKKFGFQPPEEGEDVSELKLTSFKYEKPARQVRQKDWQKVRMAACTAPEDPPVKKLDPAKFALEKPLVSGMYCFKFEVDGQLWYDGNRPNADGEGDFKVFHVDINCGFGLGFDVGL